MKQILIATKNKGKIKEFKAFFQTYNIEVKSLLDFKEEMPDIAETGTTFEENAAIKAESIAKVLNQSVLADDSGLAVDVLNGEPGIYSARYAGAEKNDQANNEKLLNSMKNIPEEQRSARFICVLAIARPGKETILKKGICEGKIGFVQKGEHGFGYDPLFIPKGYEQTMAQLSSTTKNKISHRYRAIQQLKKDIENIKA